MMAVDGLFKEFGEAFGRLFDHRPVLQGEINFCQREFEEKRGNREETRLQKCLEYGREINEKLIPHIIDSLQTEFPKFSITVAEAVSLSQQVMDKENQSAKSEWLEERRLQRSSDWRGFLDTMTTKVSNIDSELENEVALVTEHYKDLEEKLKITDRKERTEVAQNNETEDEQERVGVSENDMAEDVTIAPEAKVRDGQEGNSVEITQEADVEHSEEISEQTEIRFQENKAESIKIAEQTEEGVQNNMAEDNDSVKTAEEQTAKVAQDDKTDILPNSETLVKIGKEFNMDKTENDL